MNLWLKITCDLEDWVLWIEVHRLELIGIMKHLFQKQLPFLCQALIGFSEGDVEEELGESMAVIIHFIKATVDLSCRIPNISCVLIQINLVLIRLITD